MDFFLETLSDHNDPDTEGVGPGSKFGREAHLTATEPANRTRVVKKLIRRLNSTS
jgi:hypothetical protein